MLLRNRLLSIGKRGRTYRPNPLRWVSKLCLYSRRVSWRVPVVKRAFLYSLYQKRKTSPAASSGCNDDQCSRQRLVVRYREQNVEWLVGLAAPVTQIWCFCSGGRWSPGLLSSGKANIHVSEAGFAVTRKSIPG